MEEDAAVPSRLDRRKARTRAALIGAAQKLLAEGRQSAPILEITQLADIGLGSFYNHFETREELFAAAVADALDTHGQVLDRLTADLEDPADAFATSFRLTGRLHRMEPGLSKVVLATGLSLLASDSGLVPRLRRDLTAGAEKGSFDIEDMDVAVGLVAGAALSLGHLLHDQPERDDATTTDLMTSRLLVMLGMRPAQARKLSGRPLPDLDVVFGRQDEAAS